MLGLTKDNAIPVWTPHAALDWHLEINLSVIESLFIERCFLETPIFLTSDRPYGVHSDGMVGMFYFISNPIHINMVICFLKIH